MLDFFSIISLKTEENKFQKIQKNEFHSDSNVSTLPCEQGKAAAKDSYEIQLTHQQLSFSLLP